MYQFIVSVVCTTFTLAYPSGAQESLKQCITVHIEDQEIETALRKISKQSSIRFIYSPQLIQAGRKVTLHANNQALDHILRTLFDPLNITYEMTGKQLVLRAGPRTGPLPESLPPLLPPMADRTLSGTVTDNNGETLPGVRIVVKGTQRGTTTDVNGKYSLLMPEEEVTVIFSYVGYITQEIVVGDRTNLDVSLTVDTRTLEEVVVVGYGTQRKETLTGAVSSIRSEDIKTTKTENLISNIQGKIPGLQIRQRTGEPGTFDNLVSIRGYGSPLIVIDGIPRDGTAEMAQLNPDDIESISILKDAAASIYGMNSANGVIIITTKKGEAGKARFSYSNLLGIKGATGLERTVDAYTYRLMRNEMDKNIGNAPYYSNDILEKYRTGEPGYIDTDWISLTLHEKVFQQQHNFSVRGGSDKVKYFTSFSYTEDNGLLKSDIQKYRRYNFRVSTSSQLTNHLLLNVAVAGRNDHTQSPRNDFLWVFKPIMVNDRGQNYHTIANPGHMTALPPENTNPVAMMNPDIDGYRRNSNMQYQSNLDLTYTVPFVKGLKATVLTAYDGNIRNISSLQRAYDLYDYYTDTRQSTFGTNRYSNSINLFSRLFARGQLEYKRTLAASHNLNVIGVTEFTRTRVDNLSAARQFADLYTHDIIDQGTSTTATNGGNRSFTALAAYLTRINYDYAGKYLLEVVARYDGSYRYAPAKRWAFFPSVSAGWRISEESFIKENLPFLYDLKLRASYGESGRDVGNPFEYVAGYVGSSGSGYIFSPNQLTIGMLAPGVVNDNLSWITAKTSNIGLDFGFWNGKISGSVDVFERKNTGLLATRIQSLPNTFGASFPQENINSNLNHGIELALTHKGKIGRDFSYVLGVNTTYSREKLLHVERAPFTSSWDRWKNGNQDRYTGRLWQYDYSGRYTSLQDYETAPLMGGALGNSRMLPGSWALIDTNGDGIINANDQTPNNWAFGNINPPLQYGMTLSGNYRAFDMNVLFQGAALYSINYRNDDIWGYGRYPSLHSKFMDRWHTTGPEDDPYNPGTQWVTGYYPALRTNTSNTTDGQRIDVWTPPATYLRLKSVELGYTLPSDLLQKIKFSGLRIFANGFNLLTFCRRELRQADPERQEMDWDANLTYPLMKSYNLGINITF